MNLNLFFAYVNMLLCHRLKYALFPIIDTITIILLETFCNITYFCAFQLGEIIGTISGAKNVFKANTTYVTCQCHGDFLNSTNDYYTFISSGNDGTIRVITLGHWFVVTTIVFVILKLTVGMKLPPLHDDHEQGTY